MFKKLRIIARRANFVHSLIVWDYWTRRKINTQGVEGNEIDIAMTIHPKLKIETYYLTFNGARVSREVGATELGELTDLMLKLRAELKDKKMREIKRRLYA